MNGPDYFGEAAIMGVRGLRKATAISGSAVELLVLNKLDFDMKVGSDTRAHINLLNANFKRDETILKCASQCFLFNRNVGQVPPKIIHFHYLKKTVSGSKYPKNVSFSFENRRTGRQMAWNWLYGS